MKVELRGGRQQGRTAARNARLVETIERLRPGDTCVIILGDKVVKLSALARTALDTDQQIDRLMAIVGGVEFGTISEEAWADLVKRAAGRKHGET